MSKSIGLPRRQSKYLTYITFLSIIGILSYATFISPHTYIEQYSNILKAGSFASTSSKNDYKLVGYLNDDHNDFMIVQKHLNSVLTITDDETSNFLKYMQQNLLKDSRVDVHTLEGYDYDSMMERQHQSVIDKMNITDSIKFEMQVKFQLRFKSFFEELITTIQKCKPSVDKIGDDKHYDKDKTNGYENRLGKIPLYGGHTRENYLEEPVRTEEMLSSFLKVSNQEKDALKRSHMDFISKLPRDFPQDLYDYSEYNDFMKGDGIVYMGGGKYNQLVLLSIKTLRDTGSKVPVEVILPKTNDYDVKFCLELLPSLNGRCKVMADYLPKSFIDQIKGYQLKNVALLISSFERILYLDADNLCIKNPDILFVNKPFVDHHLVIWPDLWRRSTSPVFYDIVGIAVDPKNKLRNSYFGNDPKGHPLESEKYSYHDCEGTIPDPSSETGQILINKKVHAKTLFLSLYYNFYGPDYYYALLSQGAAGEGDKETFIAAAHKLGLKYYQVQEFTREFGPMHATSGKREFYGMGQYDPMIDYLQYNGISGNAQKEKKSYFNDAKFVPAKNAGDNKMDNYKYHLFKSSQLFFLHANWPKLYPDDLFIRRKENRVPFLNDLRRRLYNHDLVKELRGYDFEAVIFKNLHWLVCDLKIEENGLSEWGSEDRKKICEELEVENKFLAKDNGYM
ncbi:alpha-1,2-mannosyltransferase Mnn2p [[Candida] railenensis]|uniref:Alpha-1,2-mannosyltransferase Mnn2p n=1 Tax=[Candida] railenensis TaxID=45579 RepID=A0A9P0QMN6_9ASCO|nr:alpha-1,2-mannosyltransferase Mnn2p [[Candida] railenensis]